MKIANFEAELVVSVKERIDKSTSSMLLAFASTVKVIHIGSEAKLVISVKQRIDTSTSTMLLAFALTANVIHFGLLNIDYLWPESVPNSLGV